MSHAKPGHIMQPPFWKADGHLQVGGIDITRLVERVGRTPFFAYDRAVLTARVHHLRRHLPTDMHLHYSVKANPMPALVQHMSALVDGFDIASGGELTTALDTPMPSSRISFAGPGKTDAELARAIAAGVIIHAESFNELDRLAALSEAQGISAKLMVRVNPEFELKSSGMRMGGGSKPFGIDAEEIPSIISRIDRLGLVFYGLHVFSGSQSLREDAIIEAQSATFDLALRLSQETKHALSLLNIGGGFGIPYFPGDKALDLSAIGEHLHACVAHLKTQSPDTKVALELGRYLVGEAGIYVTRIIDRKVSRGQTFLITDGGMNHHLAASGNLGQVIRKNYPVAVGNKMAGAHTETVTVCGPLCTPLDILADHVELPQAEVGDLIVVFQSGAYGLSASPTNFLSHVRPEEVLV